MREGRRRDPRAALRLPSAIGADITGSVPGNLGPVRRVAEVWPLVVGDALARVAQPARLTRDGTLVVHATDASWVHALTLERRTILRKLGELLAGDAPSDLKAEIGVVTATPLEDVREPTTIRPDAQARADELTATVEDPALRDSLNRAIAASLSREKG